MKRLMIHAAMPVIAVLVFAVSATGANIDLATVPPRDTVQLTIYNSEDITLVRETRSLSLKKGVNRIQYSWANTLIDPTSVEIRPLERQDMVELLDTTFPGSKPQHLIWNIESKVEDAVKFQVTYFTSGISWSSDYVLIAGADEETLSLDGFVKITNNSGEDYENAQVRLVVGVINLVEKIADLARRGIQPPVQLGAGMAGGARKEDLAQSMKALGYSFAVAEAERARPAEIVKEGLSEYFIYTVEGTQTVPDKWSRRMVSFRAREVDFDILYRLRPHQYGPRPVRFFILKNDAEHSLGDTPLPDGLVRVFRENGRDGLAFLGTQQIAYVAINDMIELNVGTDDLVVEEVKVLSVARSGFVYDNRQRVKGWDEALSLGEEIRNYTARPIRMEIRRVIEGDVELRAENARVHDYRTVEFTLDVEPRETFSWEYSYTQRFGARERQSRMALR